jgi:FkbM family methyltransferase
MTSQAKRLIFRRLERKGFTPTHVAEVGVFLPESSNVYDWIVRGVRCTLVEPDPFSVDRIRAAFGTMSHVALHAVAIHERSGPVQLTKRQASTFLSELSTSPAIANDGAEASGGERFTVEARTFDRIDDGTIDLLSVDVEGAEWYVIRHLVSRPAVISVETHGGVYRNPKRAEIAEWMRGNGYEALYRDRSDTVFVRPEVITVTSFDRLARAIFGVLLIARRTRKAIVLKSRALLRSRSVGRLPG